MTKALLTFCLALLSSPFVSGQNNGIKNDSATNQILNELQIIRGFHEETRSQRQRAVIERQRRDSLQNRAIEEDMSTDYGIMARIEDNTHQNPMTDGWNLYGVAAFFIAVLSAAISWYTYKAQQRTEDNTKKLSQDMQRKLLNELLRHLYRNYVVTFAMRTKMKDIGYNGYPSEEHYEKLKIPMENIHLDAFYGEDEKFRLMHILYLNLRNYNTEIDVALKHVTDRSIDKETKDEDFDTLEFKVSYLTERIINTIYQIWGEDNEYKDDMREALGVSLNGETNATKNINMDGSDIFDRLTVDKLKKTSYTKLYSDNEIINMCDIFNNDVNEERKMNSRGAWKIRIIKFSPKQDSK